MKIMVADTETGGLDTTKHSVLSLGALVGDLDTGEVIESFETLIKLPTINSYIVTAKALEINKLSVAQCFKDGISPSDAVAKLSDLYINNGCQLVGGHNFDYDIEMISYQLMESTPSEFKRLFTYRKVDTCNLIQLFVGNIASGASLSKTIEALNIDVSDIKGSYHGALFDSMCSFRIMHRFRKVLNDPAVIAKLQNA